MCRWIVEVCIGHDGEPIGKHHLLQQTRQNEDDSTLNHNSRRLPPRPDLRDELSGADDGTRDEMRKKCNKQRVIDRVSDCLHLSPIDVKGVGKTGEGVEADADRKYNLQHHR